MSTMRYKDHYPFTVALFHYALVESEEDSGTLWEGPLLGHESSLLIITLWSKNGWSVFPIYHLELSHLYRLYPTNKHENTFWHCVYKNHRIFPTLFRFPGRIFFHAKGIMFSSHNSPVLVLRDEEVSFQGSGSFLRNSKRPGASAKIGREISLVVGSGAYKYIFTYCHPSAQKICLKDHSHHGPPNKTITKP